jgi:phenylalanyl-tRNA synthetase alpha subunit
MISEEEIEVDSDEINFEELKQSKFYKIRRYHDAVYFGEQ